MHSISNLLAIALLATSGAVSGAILPRAESIGHDKVEKLPASGGPNQTKFQPQLHIGNGCHSYPAVDADGNWSGGLKPTGSPSGSCRDTSKAQTYVRGADFKGKTAFLYAWYMPKDEISPSIGHRHDWEGAVVFLDSGNTKIEGVAASAHGDWRKYKNPGGDKVDGNHVKLQYSAEGVNSHAIDITDKDGDLSTLVDWAAMPGPARDAINDASHWGDANPPLADAHFEDNLNEAWMW